MKVLHSRTFALLAFLALGCSGAPMPANPVAVEELGSQPIGSQQPPIEHQARDGNEHRFALLVGCTKYDHFKESWQLKGPANDVTLFRRVLQEKFGFAADRIVTLSEASGRRPTRENIRLEIERLARMAGKDNHVVMLLCGHGSQQPDQEPFDEISGFDQVFLPCDAIPPAKESKFIGNAIIDDELQVWTRSITAKGARLWFIADCCHSGTILRGDGEVAREVPAKELFSDVVLKKAQDDARGRKISVVKDDDLRWAALYASRHHEPTLESATLAGDHEWHGLFTYSMCRILTQAKSPLTYRELARQIHEGYRNEGRFMPTPQVEGLDQDKEVLGEKSWAGRSRFSVVDKKGRWEVNGGLLHGLAQNNILAVYPAAGEADADKTLGYLKVTRADMMQAIVEPCEHANLPLIARAPVSNRVEIAVQDFDLVRLHVKKTAKGAREIVCVPDLSRARLPVAVDGAGAGAQGKLAQAFAARVREMAVDPAALWHLTKTVQEAEWLFQESKDQSGQFFLLPASMARLPNELPTGSPRFGPFDARNINELPDYLTRIARARNLLKLTTAMSTAADSSAADTSVHVEIVMFKLADPKMDRWEKVIWKNGLAFRDGDKVKWEIINHGREAVDLTILYVDALQGIHPIFPPQGTVAENTLASKKSLTLPARPATVRDRTIGWEHLVVIAFRSDGDSVDFTFLAQPNLSLATKAAMTHGDKERAMISPLGLFFKSAFYGQAVKRDLDVPALDNYALRSVSWEVVKDKK